VYINCAIKYHFNFLLFLIHASHQLVLSNVFAYTTDFATDNSFSLQYITVPLM